MRRRWNLLTAPAATAATRLGLLLLLFAGIGGLTGCQPHSPDPAPAASSGSSTTSEAERTHEMERKAADLDKRAEEIKTMNGTDQEKIDATNQLDKERRELAEQAEGTAKN
jgi:hypothetical protein